MTQGAGFTTDRARQEARSTVPFHLFRVQLKSGKSKKKELLKKKKFFLTVAISVFFHSILVVYKGNFYDALMMLESFLDIFFQNSIFLNSIYWSFLNFEISSIDELLQ